MIACDYFDLIKWMLGGMGSMLVLIAGFALREAKRRGAEEERMRRVDKAVVQLDELGPAVHALTAKVDQLVEAEEATRRKLFSEFPKVMHSLDRRVSKLEWVNDIEPTGKYILPPLDPKGNGE